MFWSLLPHFHLPNVWAPSDFLSFWRSLFYASHWPTIKCISNKFWVIVLWIPLIYFDLFISMWAKAVQIPYTNPTTDTIIMVPKWKKSFFYFKSVLFSSFKSTSYWRFAGDMNVFQMSNIGVTTCFHAGASSTSTNADVANHPSTSSSSVIPSIATKGFTRRFFFLFLFCIFPPIYFYNCKQIRYLYTFVRFKISNRFVL